MADNDQVLTLPNLVTSHPSAPAEAVGPSPNAGTESVRWRNTAPHMINSLPVLQGTANTGMGFDRDASLPVITNSSWTFYWAGRIPSLPQSSNGAAWAGYTSDHTDPVVGFVIYRLFLHANALAGDGRVFYSYTEEDNINPVEDSSTQSVAGVEGVQVLCWVFDKDVPEVRVYRNQELILTGTWVAGGGSLDFVEDFVELFTSGDNVVTPDQGLVGEWTDFWGATSAHSDAVREAFIQYLMDRLGLSAPSAAPSSLTATAVSTSAIDLSWTDNSTDETGFQIERSLDQSTWTLIATNAAGDTTYSDTGLDSGTLYYYRVRAIKDTVGTDWSNTASDTTDSVSPYALANQLWLFESDAILGLNDNDPVTTWPDDGTNTNDITFPSAGEGGTKPTYKINIFNALPAVRFASTNQGQAPVPTVTNSSYTFYYVLSYTTAAQVSGVSVMHYPQLVTGDSYVAVYVCGDMGGTNQVGVEIDFTPSDFAAATNGAQILTVKLDKVAGTATCYRNGTSIGTVTGLGSTGWDFDAVVQWFGLLGDGTAQFVGDVGALFAYSEAHDDSTRGGVEAYLSDKYL